MQVESMTSIPANSNPFHHDLCRMGVRVNDRFMVMWDHMAKNELVIVDMTTGERHRFIAPIVVPQKPQPTKPTIKKWVNIDTVA